MFYSYGRTRIDPLLAINYLILNTLFNKCIFILMILPCRMSFFPLYYDIISLVFLSFCTISQEGNYVEQEFSRGI